MDWFNESDEAIMKLLGEKNNAHKIYLSIPTKENEAKYKEIRSKCQREIRKLRDNWWSEYALHLQDFINNGILTVYTMA